MQIFTIGDIHGDYNRMILLLRKHNIIDENDSWIAGGNKLICIGDYTDRGKQGLRVINTLMRLESEAEVAGGQIITLLGNHDAMMYAMAEHTRSNDSIRSWMPDCFNYNGGLSDELEAISLKADIIHWLQSRPAMFKYNNVLWQHVDSVLCYTKHIKSTEKISTESINNYFQNKMKTAIGACDIFNDMCDYRYWDQTNSTVVDPEQHINDYMEEMGVNTIIHGHTRFKGNDPQFYFGGKIINVDGSLSEGYRKDDDRGFILIMESLECCLGKIGKWS